MAYHLGVDLGTTFTAAALFRHGRAEPISLGTNSVAIPSVAYIGDDGDLVFGQPAVRRASSQPLRVVREFKRRVGDPTPIILGDTRVPAERLMGRLLAWTVHEVTTTEGEPPAGLAITHPANWGAYKLDLFQDAIEQVGLRADHLVPEPVAAATYYATQRELAPGSVVAVYDLGGGTFDAALVRSDPTGFTIVGQPDGIERLGGVDFDYALLRHVAAILEMDLDTLDREDAALATAINQLRLACVEAKEALSAEPEVAVPVMLPDRHTEVRVTRTQFDDMIRPTLDETLVALRRTIASASLTPEDMTAVLLVGGSSRIPLIGELIASELGRPIAVDARPKDAIPMGAAVVAGRAAEPAAGASGAVGGLAAAAALPAGDAVTPRSDVPAVAWADPIGPAPAPPPLSSLAPPGGGDLPPGERTGAGSRSRTAMWVVITALVFGAGVLAAAMLSSGGDDDGNSPTPAASREEESGSTEDPGEDPGDDPGEDPGSDPGNGDPGDNDNGDDAPDQTTTPSQPQVSEVSASPTNNDPLTFVVTFSYEPAAGEVQGCEVLVGGSPTQADCQDGTGSAQVPVTTYNSPYDFTARVSIDGGAAWAEGSAASGPKPLEVDASENRWSGSCYFPEYGESRPVTEAPNQACREGGEGPDYQIRMAPDGSIQQAVCWKQDVTIRDQQLNESDIWIQLEDGGWMHALYFRDWDTAQDHLPPCDG